MKTLWLVVLVLLCVVLVAGNGAAPLRAQKSALWTEPANLSQSGGASAPVIAVARSGAFHALWWDAIDGSRYARGVISNSVPIWGKPVALPAIVAGFDRSNINRPVPLPPIKPRLEFGENGVGHLLFRSNASDLLYATVQAEQYSAPAVLARSVLASDSFIDISNTLTLAYVVTDTRIQPAGIYYARRGQSLRASPVITSPYFRTARESDVQVSVASNTSNIVILTWLQSRDEQARVSRSIDGGLTWLPPEPVVSRSAQSGLASQTSVTYLPNGEFMLLWRDAGASGCGFTQRRSNDNGATWTAPERVLGELRTCPTEWRFYRSGGALWFVGTQQRTLGADNSITLARWGVDAWTVSPNVDFGSEDPVTRRSRTLNCVNASIGLEQIALIGCDTRRDVFASVNAVSITQLLPALNSPWTAARPIGLQAGAIRSVNTAIGLNGAPFALIGLSPSDANRSANTLLLSQESQGIWGNASSAVQASSAGSSGQPVAVAMNKPSFAISADRMHVAWRGGESGRVFYSRAFLREAASRDGWSAPVALPSASPVGGAPALVRDPRADTLHVLYPVAFNEARGIYFSTSNDGGASWLTPTLAFDAAAAGWVGVDEPQLLLDPRGNFLHALWFRLNSADPAAPRTLVYARSTDDGATWMQPQVIGDGLIHAPRLALATNGALMAIWTRAVPSNAPETPVETLSAVSSDNGQNWSQPAQVPGFEVISGEAALTAADGGAMMLAALGATASNESQLLVSTWQDDKWSAPERVLMRQPADAANTVTLAIQPSGTLHALLTLGVLQTDGSLKTELRTVSRAIAPSNPKPLPPMRLKATVQPTPAPTATVRVPPTATPAPVSTAAPDLSPVRGANQQLIYGLAAAIAAIFIALVVFSILRRR